MPIVGTAGHVDHGKSTLVEALTGRDPDRWDEEKVRGLTIDLGFAWTELRPGVIAGFVDVPGHERFMKNMLAGVGALDVALFVVAADELWMPQTEEHLAVLDLLDVRHGVIAMTRADLADADMIELGQLEIQEKVAGTTLEGWPISVVSAVSGLGIEQLRVNLAQAIDNAGPPLNIGRPRLWVDRSFVISGAGMVVTGTLAGGALRRGDMLDLFPGERVVRVRGLQSHERDVESAHPGTRTAINLAGIERAEIARGSLLAGREQARVTREFLTDIRTVRGYSEGLTERGAFHLHLGSGVWPMRLRPISAETIDDSGTGLISVREPLPVQMGDRFIVREVGRRAVVAGGRVLDAAPRGRLAVIGLTAPALRKTLDRTAADRAQALLEVRGVSGIRSLDIDSGGGSPLRGIFAGDGVASEQEGAALADSLEIDIREYQEANPLRPGAPKASLATGRGVAADMLDAIVARSDRLVDEGAWARTADFSGSLSETDDASWRAARAALGEALAVPRAGQLGLHQELLHALARSGQVVRIDDNLYYLPEQIEQVTGILATLESEFTVAQFRDALSVSRRHAIPLLEWLDAQGWTVRRGDVRSVRTPSER